jgi:hypothetical protein
VGTCANTFCTHAAGYAGECAVVDQKRIHNVLLAQLKIGQVFLGAIVEAVSTFSEFVLINLFCFRFNKMLNSLYICSSLKKKYANNSICFDSLRAVF